jgi:acetylornithine deacetylase
MQRETAASNFIVRSEAPVFWWFFMNLDPIQLTRRLVDMASITYDEGAVGSFLLDFLAGRGFAVEKMPVEQAGESASASERFNVYACLPGKTPEVVFSTHMDTVPPFIPSSEDDEFIYGRGSCDAKGIIAAQIAAAERLQAQGVSAGLLFVVGEERDSAGAKAANLHPRGSRFLINGEPTDNRAALASKGTLRAVIRTRGKMAHSAYPELGESATHKMVEALRRILEIPLPSLDSIGPSTLNIGTIHGGHAPNVIADAAEAQVLVRLVGPSEETRAAIQRAVQGIATVDFTLEIPFRRFHPPAGLPTMVAAFTTDIPWLGNWGEPVLLGPGSIHVAHTPDERLAKKELFTAIELYVKTAGGLLTPSHSSA